MSAKVCDKCSSEQDATVAKCTECGNDTFTPMGTSVAVKAVSNANAERDNAENYLSLDEKILSAIYTLISEQKKTRFYIRWGFGVIGLTLLLAFYGIGVKVNLSPTTITPYP